MQTKQKRKEPMTKAKAQEILNDAIRRQMAADGVGYGAAFDNLQRERPALIEAYEAVIRRTKTKKEITK